MSKTPSKPEKRVNKIKYWPAPSPATSASSLRPPTSRTLSLNPDRARKLRASIVSLTEFTQKLSEEALGLLSLSLEVPAMSEHRRRIKLHAEQIRQTLRDIESSL